MKIIQYELFLSKRKSIEEIAIHSLPARETAAKLICGKKMSSIDFWLVQGNKHIPGLHLKCHFPGGMVIDEPQKQEVLCR